MIQILQKALVVFTIVIFSFGSAFSAEPPVPDTINKAGEWQILESARNTALNALATHDECARLFNWPAVSAGHDPSRVLKYLLNNYRSSVGLEAGVFLTTAPLENGSAGNIHAAVTQLSHLKNSKGELVGIQILVVLNSTPGSFGQNANDLAVLLLHELGHVFTDLWGPDSTLIRQDSQRPEQSFENTRMVRTSCHLGSQSEPARPKKSKLATEQ